MVLAVVEVPRSDFIAWNFFRDFSDPTIWYTADFEMLNLASISTLGTFFFINSQTSSLLSMERTVLFRLREVEGSILAILQEVVFEQRSANK